MATIMQVFSTDD